MNKNISSNRFSGYLQTFLILSFLTYVIYYFYTWEDTKSLHPFFGVIFLSVLTDALFVFIHLPRKRIAHKNLSFDPSKLTIIIACYNGEQIVGETIRQAAMHVPKNQILVISDASTDNTAAVSRSHGVDVHENTENLNKAFSISAAIHKIKTPYVLILDDDTLIGDTFIPTSLLDDGYSAVAFNVMPIYTGTLLNKLQIFEYRKSMTMGKSLRAKAGAVGNISGALGLYRTADLVDQVEKHSGQFGGEDQQRTALVHLEGLEGRGVTFTDHTVHTLAPATWKSFAKQRSMRWNLSLPELFVMYMKILVDPRFHFLLKAEKAYQIYLLMTDPLRMLFFWAIFIYPMQALILYLFYTCLVLAVWWKIGRKDPLHVVLVYPIFSMFESICRFVAHFYWFKIKYHYLVHKKHHRRVKKRNLMLEYGAVMVLLVTIWGTSASSMQRSIPYIYIPDYYLFDDEPVISSNELDGQLASVGSVVGSIQASPAKSSCLGKNYDIRVDYGDGKTHIARKAVMAYNVEHNISLTPDQIRFTEYYLQAEIPSTGTYTENKTISVGVCSVEKHVNTTIDRYP